MATIKLNPSTSPSVELSSYRDQHFKGVPRGNGITSSVCLEIKKVIYTMDPALLDFDLFEKNRLHVYGSRAEQDRLLRISTTLYVGNLSFYTTEEQIYELFSKCGDIRRIIMGLDKYKKTPCGFCFVEYYQRADAENCMRYINGTRLDDRIIRTDWDAGFIEGRQYGRGKTGGQVRDEYRSDFDSGRGGYGKIIQQKVTPLSDGAFGR